LLVLEVAAAEQRTEDWDVFCARQPIDILLGGSRDETSERQRAAGWQLDDRLCLARVEYRIARHVARDFADTRIDLEADAPFRQNNRREAQLHAELFECDRADARSDVDTGDVRHLATGQELGRFSGNRSEIGLRKRPYKSVTFEGADGRADLIIAI